MSDNFWQYFWTFLGIAATQIPLIISALRTSRKVNVANLKMDKMHEENAGILAVAEATQAMAHDAKSAAVELQVEQRQFVDYMRTNTFQAVELVGALKERQRASQFDGLSTDTNLSDLPPR